MDMLQAMRERHTVRRYLDRPLEADVLVGVQDCLRAANERFGTDVRLVTDDESAFNAALRLVLAKGVRNYFVLAGTQGAQGATLHERLGMASAEIMLRCQTLGLNTWWVGGTFSRKAVAATVPGEVMVGVVAVGYGATQGKPHKSKAPAEVSSYEGEAPAWFTSGVEAALLAPTALNRQAFTLRGAGDVVEASYAPGAFSGEDLGLVKYHFELGAGVGNFRWA